MTTLITSTADLLLWDGTGTAKLTTDIIIDSSDANSFPLNISGRFTGQRFTITLGENVYLQGLFIPVSSSTVVVEKLTVFVSASAVLPTGTGVIIASTVSTPTFVLTVKNCGVIGLFIIPSRGGGLIGESGTGSNLTINGCYSTGAISESFSGGIIGQSAGYGGTVDITNCYSTGSITGLGSGGIAGRFFANAGTGTITNCYSTGEINLYSSSNSAGGIVGTSVSYSSGSTTILNCYSSGDLTAGGGICGNIDLATSSVTITNCYSKGATGTGLADTEYVGSGTNSGTATITNSGYESGGTWAAVLGTNLLNDSSYDNSVSNLPFLLTHFQGEPWNTSEYTSAGDTNIGYAAGDPHIMTIFGNKYDLITKGYFTYFDNHSQNPEERIIITAKAGKFQFARWTEMEYIQTIFIQYGHKTCTLSTGFRGIPATILDNTDNLDIINNTLPISSVFKIYCKECRYKTDHEQRALKHELTNGHELLKRVRNELILKILTPENKYILMVSNVDETNYNPCKVQLSVHDITASKLNEYTGAIMKVSRNEHLHDCVIQSFTISK